MSLYGRVPELQIGSAGGTYTVEQLHSYMRISESAGTNHLVSAAEYIVQVFRTNNIPVAIMGGFSLLLRGSPRETQDVDIAVGCTMLQLLQVLSDQECILRPAGPVSGVMRIFVRMGGEIDQAIEGTYVMVDIILHGSLGAPDDPRTSSEVVNVQTHLGLKAFPVLDVATIMSSKLGAFFGRGATSDFQDISWLLDNFPEKIHNVRTQLNQTHRQAFVNTFAQRNPGSSNENRVRRVRFSLGIP
ncbi:hypothetical protein FQN50_009062 [Emmonsiellopsis sp. PD_5]|nr:hypothetical protein FQN50_009062 [Emmonsiellopsis sp. PD_5]